MQVLLAQRRQASSQASEAEASFVGCSSSATTTAPPGEVSKHPKTKHGCNLIKVFQEQQDEWRRRRETAEVTDLLQGGPQL